MRLRITIEFERRPKPDKPAQPAGAAAMPSAPSANLPNQRPDFRAGRYL